MKLIIGFIIAQLFIICKASISEIWRNRIDESLRNENVRVLGGDFAKIEEYPYQVAVFRWNTQKVSFCGGAIITEYYVITAGHCLDSTDPTNYYIRSGSEFRRHGGNEHMIAEIIRHEEFKLLSDKVRAENDIGLMKIKAPFTFDKLCKPIKLFTKTDEINDKSVGVITGWGLYKLDEWLSEELRFINLPIVNKEKCNELFMDRYGGIRPKQICAGYINDGSKGLCFGDSGSPLVINGKMAGIVSWGAEPCGQDHSPAVFTEVAEYRTWISKFVNVTDA